MTRVAVMGSGSWGTAFAKVLADAGAEVALWGRRAEVVDEVNQSHANSQYLPDIVLPPSIWATTDGAKALADAEVIVLALPSQSLRRILTELTTYVPERAAVVSLMKGVELGTTRRMSEVIIEVTGMSPARFRFDETARTLSTL